MSHLDYFDSISVEFYKKMESVDSINELIKVFEDFVVYESKLITNKIYRGFKNMLLQENI